MADERVTRLANDSMARDFALLALSCHKYLIKEMFKAHKPLRSQGASSFRGSQRPEKDLNQSNERSKGAPNGTPPG